MLAQMEVRLLWDFLPQPSDVLLFSSSLFSVFPLSGSVEIFTTLGLILLIKLLFFYTSKCTYTIELKKKQVALHKSSLRCQPTL